MSRVPAARIPPELRPRWRDLPQLTWTMARADAPGASALGVTFAGLLLYAPTVVGAQAGGALASHEPNALLIVVLNPSRWLQLARTGATATTAAIIWAPFFALPYFTAPPLAGRIATAGVSPGVAVTISTTLAAVLLGVPLLCAMSGRIITLGTVLTEYAHRRDSRPFLKPVRRNAIRVHGFAAWPHRCGHGTALVNMIAPVVASAAAATGRPVIAFARTTSLAAIYQRWGLHPITPGARAMLGPTGKDL